MMALGRYILNANGDAEPCEDLMTWALWLETADRRVCAAFDESVPGEDLEHRVMVSTVFLAIDHNFSGHGAPILWETMVFNGPLHGATDRYTSKEDAVIGHQAMCARVAAAMRPSDIATTEA